MKVFEFLSRLTHYIKRYIVLFFLRRVLGWEIDKSYDDYKSLRTGGHVMTYTHTCDYDIIIGCLLSHAYDLPVVTIAKDELGKIPIISKMLSIMSDVIFINRKSNVSTTNFIATQLKERSNFVLLVAPEGTRKKVDDIKSGFYHIAVETNSDIYHMAIDFENHTVAMNFVANDAVLQTSQYTKIKLLVENEMKKDRPYRPDRCHLVDPTKMGQTTLLNNNCSILIYIPPIIVFVIILSTLANTLTNTLTITSTITLKNIFI